MASFTVRIELHNANRENYEELHEQMATQGFKNTITSDSGASYYLPPAEYNFEGSATRDQVLQGAKSAAASVKSSISQTYGSARRKRVPSTALGLYTLPRKSVPFR